MKYCSQCGSPTEDESRFCMKCGTPFKPQPIHEPEINTPNAALHPQDYAADMPRPLTVQSTAQASGRKKFLIGIVGIAAILIVTVAVLLATGVLPELFSSDSQEAYEDDEREDTEDADHKTGSSSGLFGFLHDEESDPPEQDQPEFQTPEPTPEALPTQTPVPEVIAGTLTAWVSSESDGFMMQDAASRVPGLEVSYEVLSSDDYAVRMNVALASGDLPDVFIMNDYSINVKSFIESGALLDLSVLESKASAVETMSCLLQYGRDEAGVLRACTGNGNIGVMYYRGSLARKYLGTDDPAEVQAMVSTLEGLSETARILYDASGGKCKFTSVGEMNRPALYSKTNPWVVQNSLMVTDDTFNSDYLQVARSLYDYGCLADWDVWGGAWIEHLSSSPNAADGNDTEVFSYFMPSWAIWLFASVTDQTDAYGDWAVIKGPNNYMMDNTWIGADAYTENPAAAIKLIEIMTMDEEYLENWARSQNVMVSSNLVNRRILDIGILPAFNNQNVFQVILDASYDASGWAFTPYDKTINSLWEETALSVIKGQTSLDDAKEAFIRKVHSELPELN
jgi:multiple sugar transport system substrate-binding protein